MDCNGLNRFQFEIYGTPKPKERPRGIIVNGHAVVYTPKRTKENEKTIAFAYHNACNRLNISTRQFFDVNKVLRVHLTFAFKVPVKFSKIKTNACLLGVIRPTAGGDVDNLAKLVLDALNGVAWADDKQVVELCVKKIYCTEEKTLVEIYDITKDFEVFKNEKNS